MRKSSYGGIVPALAPALVLCTAAMVGLLRNQEPPVPGRIVLGPTAVVAEEQSGMPFVARVDTGAKTCSVHCERFEIDDASPAMEANIGKPIRVLLANKDGEATWIETTVLEVATIRTSERSEKRYKVELNLTVDGVAKPVLVSLNDRSRMTYAMLLGRNYLRDDFLVNVDL